MKILTKSLIALGVTTLVSTNIIAATYEFRTPLNATTTFVQSEEKPDKPVERGPIDLNGYCEVYTLVNPIYYQPSYVYFTQGTLSSAELYFKNTKMATFQWNVDYCVRGHIAYPDLVKGYAYEFADKYAKSDLKFLGREITDDAVIEYGNKFLTGELVPLKPLNWENGASEKLHFRDKNSLCNYQAGLYSSDKVDTPFFYNACMNVKKLIAEPLNIKDFKGMSAYGLSTSAITQKSNLWQYPAENFKLSETQLSFNITGLGWNEDQAFLINAINNEVHSITVENQSNGNIKACTKITAKAAKIGVWPAILVTCTDFIGEGVIAVPNSTTVFSLNK
ncbi:hypothetical protein RX880_07915 [Pseudomonas syringae pv. actinidiae]|nr:hypothetical protein [Pseudomonas syringae pv. actinidiae]MDU8099220.1 hypothetical protein [Pseudomonas syringae pv. actinidiae]MDU8115744.1 hypothetical protein [Pseudomonas syringae pv. actinidiae]MDU8131840.1 hypothetical protein [Pseudomonas syringae pv. actinidiae]MDU8153130.1 hypothetical protein [Pseudomonas syringae pv. actinidiae]